MENALDSVLFITGYAALILFIHFFIRNVRYGSAQTTLPEYPDGLGDKQSIEFFDLLVAHLHNWYLVLFQIVVSFLLICTPTGRDVVNYLLDTTNQMSMAAATGHILLIVISFYLYSVSFWIIPWHILDCKSREQLRFDLPQLKTLRILGLLTYIVIMVAMVAAYANSRLDEMGKFYTWPFLSVIAGLYLLYWVLLRFMGKFDKSDLRAEKIFWAVLTVITLGSAVYFYRENEIGRGNFQVISLFCGWVFWMFTSRISPTKDKPKRTDIFTYLSYHYIDPVLVFFQKKLLQADEVINSRLHKIFPNPPSIERCETHPAEMFAKANQQQKDKSRDLQERLKRNRMAYRFLMWSSFIVAYGFALLPNLQPVTPFMVVFAGIGFLSLMVDTMFYTGKRIISLRSQGLSADQVQLTVSAVPLLQRFLNNCKMLFQKPFYTYKKTLRRYELSLFMVWVLSVLILSFSSETGRAAVEPVPNTRQLSRVNIKDYLDGWASERSAAIAQDSVYQVFIIAGQGGGSRAAYWTAASLKTLTQKLGFDFNQHILAISTVSGSSPGTAAYLGWLHKNTRPGQPLTPQEVDNLGQYCEEVFKGNFVTSGVSGNLFGDLLRKYWPFTLGNHIKDRNRRLSEEEAWGIHNALYTPGEAGHLWTRLYDDQQFGWQPFSSVYQKENGQLRYDLPLFIPNSTHVQTGRRAIISPVLNISDQNYFLNSIDLWRRMADSMPQQELSVIQAADLSQLFPYVSAAAYIPKNMGMYVDGGYFENYGLGTALGIYRACMDWKKDPTHRELKAKIKFNVIAVINSFNSEEDDAHCSNLNLNYTSPNQFLAPVTTMYSSAFSGHAATQRLEVKQELDADQAYWEITLNSSQLPLSRLLTEQNIKTMNGLLDTASYKVIQHFRKK